MQGKRTEKAPGGSTRSPATAGSASGRRKRGSVTEGRQRRGLLERDARWQSPRLSVLRKAGSEAIC